MALSWLVFKLTGSSTHLGAVMFCSQIPVFLLVPLGGLIADRYPKRTVLMFTQCSYMILAGIIATLTLTEVVAIWHIYAISVLVGMTTAVDMPTRQAFIVHMVEGKEDLANAIVLNSTMFNGARLIGPSVAGLLVAWMGEGYCFLSNAVSYIAVLTSLANLTVDGFSPSEVKEKPIESLKGGFRFAIKNQPVSSLMLAVATMSFNGSAHTVLMPVFASDVLHGDSKTMGILLAVEGIGAIVGALVLACKRTLDGLDKVIAVASVSCGVLLMLFSMTRNIWLASCCLIPLGVTIVGQLSVTNTLLQYLTPDNLRGRVMSLHAMMFMGLNPIGAFVFGLIADHIGTPYTLAISGVLLLVGSLRFVFTLREFRINSQRLGRETERQNALLESYSCQP